MTTLTINGAEVRVPEDRTVLQAAKAIGVRIPTLCHHEALSPYGSCRLCVVEIVKDGRSRIVTSCNYPVREGMEVLTHSEKVLTHRKMLAELLLARCPETPAVQKIAAELGVGKPRFSVSKSDCVLCGLCVRVCEERIGASAISFVNRGIDEQVAAPFQMSPEACIACGACASVCPTGAIKVTTTDGMMKIDKFGTAKRLRQCPSCKKAYAAESHLARLGAVLGPHAYLTSLCPECKRTEGSRLARMISTYQRNRPQG
jgi:bidirectional [NiFe] hydrogenase diaphorase subunit